MESSDSEIGSVAELSPTPFPELRSASARRAPRFGGVWGIVKQEASHARSPSGTEASKQRPALQASSKGRIAFEYEALLLRELNHGAMFVHTSAVTKRAM